MMTGQHILPITFLNDSAEKLAERMSTNVIQKILQTINPDKADALGDPQNDWKFLLCNTSTRLTRHNIKWTHNFKTT
jgi:hypothetical protein